MQVQFAGFVEGLMDNSIMLKLESSRFQRYYLGTVCHSRLNEGQGNGPYEYNDSGDE
jgi:hypothetical protein